MPKIAVDARVLQRPPYTGVNKYLSSLLSEWRDSGVSKDIKLYFNQRAPLLKEINIHNYSFKHYRVPSKLLSASLILFNRPNAGSFISEDILFMPNANYISWQDRRPLVVAVHDISFILFPEFFGLKQRIWHRLLKFHSLLKRADLIITNSTATTRDLFSIFPEINHNRIITIPLGVDSYLFDSDSGASEEVSPPKRYMLYVGTLEPRKNVVSIIHAFNRIAEEDNEIFLILAGAVGWKSNKIFSAIRKSPFQSRIIYKNYVSEEEKIYLYKNASVFVFPSFYEGFGLPPLEAMALGCPVVASSAGSLPEVLGDAAILVSPYHTEELASAIKTILNDENLSTALRKEGRVHALKYSWTETARKTYDAIKSL